MNSLDAYELERERRRQKRIIQIGACVVIIAAGIVYFALVSIRRWDRDFDRAIPRDASQVHNMRLLPSRSASISLVSEPHAITDVYLQAAIVEAMNSRRSSGTTVSRGDPSDWAVIIEVETSGGTFYYNVSHRRYADATTFMIFEGSPSGWVLANGRADDLEDVLKDAAGRTRQQPAILSWPPA